MIIILKATIVPSIEDRVARKKAEIANGQLTLQLESQRVHEYRENLLKQIETAKAKK